MFSSEERHKSKKINLKLAIYMYTLAQNDLRMLIHMFCVISIYND